MSSDKNGGGQEVAQREERDVETTAKKLPYPKSVFLIVANEFCERFSYYGMRAILAIYLQNELGFKENTATVIYHTFTMFDYITPIFGGMIADSILGKFRTIFYLSIVYALGNIVLSLAATPPLHIPNVPFSMIGLTLIGIGTGGIKPCVSAFGGDQFKLPEQEKQLGSFFSVFYFAINAGSLISTFITPIFRRDIGCFGDETCYTLAFSVPAGLMLTSIVVFMVGKPYYVIREPEGNVIISVIKTIRYALKRKGKSKEKREHFLDHADDKYTKREIEDIKILLRVLILYIPIPLFWALFDQQGSRWTFQATRMNGDLGGFVIKPDQMQVINPILILALIPIFDQIIYPLFAKVGLLKKPLQRMAVGGVLAGIAFVVSGIVELELKNTYPVELELGQSHLHLVNMAHANLSGNLYYLSDEKEIDRGVISLNENSNYIQGLLETGEYTIRFDGQEPDFTFHMLDQNASTILITGQGGVLNYTLPRAPEGSEIGVGDSLEKSAEGNPYLSIIQQGLWLEPENADDNATKVDNLFWKVGLQEVKKKKKYFTFAYEGDESIYPDYQSTHPQEIDINEYEIFIGTGAVGEGSILLNETVKLELGGSYVLTIIAENRDLENPKFRIQLNTLISPNSVSMLWLLPQYFILSVAEIMFSITIMDFSYSQAPKSMKSVMQSAWLLTVAIGNLIDVIVAAAEIFKEQWKEFFLFAGLMFVDIAIFAYMAYRYKPANLEEEKEEEESLEPAETRSIKDNDTDKDR